MATWKLTIEDDEGQKTVVPLVRDEYTVGRREGHTLRLTERNVSRDHARLRRDGESFVVEDLGSYNGVFVNGHRLREPRVLSSGDLVLIGDYRIEAHDEDQASRAIPAVTPPMPPVVAAAAAAAAAAAPVASVSTSVPPIESPRARIVVLSGEGAGKEHSIERPRAILGRGDDVAVFVNDSSVSRHHCELRLLEDGRVEVVDLGSQNGLRIAGKEVTKGLLSPGALFEAGDVILKYVPSGERFVFDEAAAAAARTAVAKARSAASSSPLAWIVALVVIAAAAAGGVMLARQSKTGADAKADPPSMKLPTAAGASTSDTIERAYKKLQGGDLEAAHDDVKELGEPSKLRADKHYAE
ncbi:MAG: FHA domain-containing protein, partial [Polyangiales bacterium]